MKRAIRKGEAFVWTSPTGRKSDYVVTSVTAGEVHVRKRGTRRAYRVSRKSNGYLMGRPAPLKAGARG